MVIGCQHRVQALIGLFHLNLDREGKVRPEEAAEKLNSLKGTGFSPYISPLESTRL